MPRISEGFLDCSECHAGNHPHDKGDDSQAEYQWSARRNRYSFTGDNRGELEPQLELVAAELSIGENLLRGGKVKVGVVQ
jgi:hypothetical protein